MKILIIDDEETVGRSLVRGFRFFKQEAWFALNAKDGERLWIEIQPDIVFLDVIMPVMTGPELLKVMRSREMDKLKTKSRVFLMSAFTPEDVDRSLADGFIEKPILDLNKFIEKILKEA